MFRWVLYCAKDRQNNNEPLHPGWDGGGVGASDLTRLHFRHSRKLLFGSVEPSLAALIRAAFDLSSQSTVNKTISIPVGMEIVLELVT